MASLQTNLRLSVVENNLEAAEDKQDDVDQHGAENGRRDTVLARGGYEGVC